MTMKIFLTCIIHGLNKIYGFETDSIPLFNVYSQFEIRKRQHRQR